MGQKQRFKSCTFPITKPRGCGFRWTVIPSRGATPRRWVCYLEAKPSKRNGSTSDQAKKAARNPKKTPEHPHFKNSPPAQEHLKHPAAPQIFSSPPPVFSPRPLKKTAAGGASGAGAHQLPGRRKATEDWPVPVLWRDGRTRPPSLVGFSR